ncbi:MAG: retropepsin-like aspartic protease [Saprospiraceae bacterium]|nr:retropepsin-like aspartic protease [Saprospiraceae bacterium]
MRTATIFTLLLITKICFGQTDFTFNNGGTDQANYYASFPYENINDKIIIKIKIKESIYRFILDTGAPTTISTRLFDELAPDIMAKIAISDANAATDSAVVVSLDEIFVGDIAFKNIPTLVAKPHIIFECFEIDGIIGSNLLRNSVLQIDESNKQVIITDDVKKLNLSAGQSSKLLLNAQSSPYIWIKLKNRKKAKELLLFDSGMQGLYDLALAHLGTFQKYNIFEALGKSSGSNAMSLHGMAKDTTMYRLRLPIMEINGHKLLNIATETTLDNSSRIGAGLLQYGIVTVDYKNKKFYFNPYAAKETDASEKQFAVSLVPKNNKLHIGAVWDTELNTKISVGDQVIAIDGINYENVNICDLMLKPVLKDKDKIVLTTRDNSGENTETTIERE